MGRRLLALEPQPLRPPLASALSTGALRDIAKPCVFVSQDAELAQDFFPGLESRTCVTAA